MLLYRRALVKHSVYTYRALYHICQCVMFLQIFFKQCLNPAMNLRTAAHKSLTVTTRTLTQQMELNFGFLYSSAKHLAKLQV